MTSVCAYLNTHICVCVCVHIDIIYIYGAYTNIGLLVIEKKKFHVKVVYVQNELFINDYKIKRLEITSYEKLKMCNLGKKAVLNMWK